ncbi:Uncharacterised protein [Shigella flexneri]|nr:Uncharacterised protein [Shigella flexneri]
MHFLTFFGIEGICIVIVSLYFAGVLSAAMILPSNSGHAAK